MPYRIDVRDAAAGLFERLIELGALDVEASDTGAVAALMPDGVTPEWIAAVLGVRAAEMVVSPAVGRDQGSVWTISPGSVTFGKCRIVPADSAEQPGTTLRLADSVAFGTGLHATTALCLEALDEIAAAERLGAVLDVGTGSGVLALAALTIGVPQAVALDVDEGAVRIAAENARINGLDKRLHLLRGGPDAVRGAWPLVLANILAAPLIEMAPTLVRRIAHRGHLVLSGIPSSVAADVDRTYRGLGMRGMRSTSRDGWVAIVMQATW